MASKPTPEPVPELDSIPMPILHLVASTTRDLAQAIRVPVIDGILDRTVPAVKQVADARAELASDSISLGRAQFEFNVQLLDRLTEVRDWRELLPI